MTTLLGGCHCGAITVTIALSGPAESYPPRACDCDFCTKHGAAYLSDPKGSLAIQVNAPEVEGSYSQGSNQAEMLLCKRCGVVVAATYADRGELFGAVNSRAIQDARFGPVTAVSPKELSPESKVQRWRQVWFPNVSVKRA